MKFTNVVTTQAINGIVYHICSCGAKIKEVSGSDERRFLKRHPKLCNERRSLARELAAGTRCVDAEDLMGKKEEEGK